MRNHGLTRYNADGCRCVICVSAKRTSFAAWRARNRVRPYSDSDLRECVRCNVCGAADFAGAQHACERVSISDYAYANQHHERDQMGSQFGELYERRRCYIHAVGRAPGESIPYHPGCVECYQRRGHLPEDQRDVPGDPLLFRRFSRFMGVGGTNVVTFSAYQRKQMGLGARGNHHDDADTVDCSGVPGDRPVICGDERSVPGDGGPEHECNKAAA